MRIRYSNRFRKGKKININTFSNIVDATESYFIELSPIDSGFLIKFLLKKGKDI